MTPFLRRALLSSLLVLATASVAHAQTIASDFEIEQMKAQASRAAGFLQQLQAHLNLGDLYRSRNDVSLSRTEYATALRIAENERTRSRHDGDLTRYVTATTYAALVNAKQSRAPQAFALLEEATRYASGTARTWNIASIAMRELREPRKAVAAAENAVAIATAAASNAENADTLLDLGVYR